MRSKMVIALSFSCVGLVALASPACSSSSTTPPSTDSGPADVKTKMDVSTDVNMMMDTAPQPCTSPGDAAGLLGAPSCGMCLASMCPNDAGDLLMQCACEPDCIKALECLDACVKAGGSAAGCAIPCLTKEDGGSVMATGAALLGCVGTSSSAPCFEACTPSTSEAGAPDAGDAGDGS